MKATSISLLLCCWILCKNEREGEHFSEVRRHLAYPPSCSVHSLRCGLGTLVINWIVCPPGPLNSC